MAVPDGAVVLTSLNVNEAEAKLIERALEVVERQSNARRGSAGNQRQNASQQAERREGGQQTEEESE